jgi:hypothetical protein
MSPRSRARRGAAPSGAALGLLLALLLALFALAPLTYPGFFQARSGFLPALNAANPETAPHWGHPAGSDPGVSLQGEGKLPYLLAQPFYALTGSGVAAVKWGYGLAFLLGAAGVYGWTRRRLGSRGAALAAVVYTYLPWHLSAVYVRGAYAEAWLWAAWPFLLWAADGARGLAGKLGALLAGAALLAATFWMQAGLAALFLPLLVLYVLVVHVPRRPVGPWLGAGLLLLGLILPAAVAATAVAAAAAAPAVGAFSDQFLYPFQLFSDAGSEGLSFQLGSVAVGLSLVALALVAGRRDGGLPAGMGRLLWFFALALAAIVALTLPLSAAIWRVTGFENLATAPWQVLALAGLPLAFLAGATVRLDRRLAALPALAGLLALTILASYPRLAPDFTRVDPGAEPPAAFQPVGADAAQILLLDYAIEPPTEITPTLTLTLTWQAVALPQQAPVAEDYTVFLHLLDSEGEKVAQRDSQPCDGECPTSGWQPGQIVADRHSLSLPPGAALGPYRLALGLYLLESGDRAAVLGRDDRTVYFDVP